MQSTPLERAMPWLFVLGILLLWGLICVVFSLSLIHI